MKHKILPEQEYSPNWDDWEEIAVYGDWLEDQGRYSEAAGVRFLVSYKREPSFNKSIDPRKHGWWCRAFSLWMDQGLLCLEEPDDLPYNLFPTPEPDWCSGYWVKFSSKEEAYRGFLNQLREHPEKVKLLESSQ